VVKKRFFQDEFGYQYIGGDRDSTIHYHEPKKKGLLTFDFHRLTSLPKAVIGTQGLNRWQNIFITFETFSHIMIFWQNFLPFLHKH
jgi:hypothetical protein